MAKALIAAIPLGLGLVAAVVVLLAISPGSFGFDSWPSSPAAPPRENAVVIEQPVKLAGRGRIVADHATPVARADARKHAATPDGSLVARTDSSAPRTTPATGHGPRRHAADRPSAAPSPSLTKTSPAPDAPVAPAPATGPVAAPPDVVAAEPTPSVPAVPQGESGARPAAPSQTPTAPPAEQTPSDPGAQDEGDENGVLWILPGFRGHRGHGHGDRGNGHRTPPGHRDDRK
jgi:hypothetical protein